MNPPARARQRKMLRQILCLAALFGLAAHASYAEDVTLPGDRLALTTDGDIGVNIETQAGMSAGVRVTGGDLSCLKTQTGQVVEIHTESCGDELGHLTLLVPPGYPISLSLNGDGDVHVDDIGGALSATLNGGGALTAGRVGDLMLAVHGSGDATLGYVEGSADLGMTGSGDVKLARVQGALHTHSSGSGELEIGSITSPAADILIEGSGDVTIGGGTIGALRAQSNASGDLTVAAQVVAADLQASGGGDMKLSNVTGVAKRHASGGSDITVGGSATDVDSLTQLKNLQNLDQLQDLKQLKALDALKGLSINLSDDDSPHHSTHHNDGGAFFHFIAGVVVLVLLYFAWRTVQRNGGWGAVQNRVTSPGGPSHPGVQAVRDTLSRLDGRLAQVETYVTTREFDLQRKFRDLDKT